MLPAALAASLVLSGCDGDSLSPGAKANRPIPEKLLNEMESKNMDKGAPMLVRLFKQEAELEVWKQDRTGRFALLKTYPICRWSGDIGPKVREGDRQAPEGFYSITPAQMNPNSGYYLSFNIGYPNAYDRAWGRSGSQLMVHGDCSSRGCYAMTDEQISEIYALGRESFFGGQNAFQVQAYPFRMTAENMARNRDNPNMPFWRMIKEGNDYFEVTKQEPKVDFCEKKYVFGAQSPNGRPLSFNASAKCPAYEVPASIADAVKDKQRADNSKLAELISRGTPVSKSRAGIDGGMHPVFASKLPDPQSVAMTDATDFTVASYGAAPGTIPAHVNPPKLPDAPVADNPGMTDSGSMTAATANANASTNAKPGATGGSFFSNLAAKVGFGGNKQQEPQTAPVQTAAKPATATAPKSKPIPKTSDVARATETAPASQARVISLDKNKPSQTTATAQAKSPFPDPPAQAPAPAQSMAGAQPTVPAGTFDSRWSSFR